MPDSVNLKSKSLSGDTIVEVLFAVAILGFVVLAALNVMQQGTSAAQLSLEINLVRNQMNAQAEAIRLIHASAQARERTEEAGKGNPYFQVWQELISNTNSIQPWDNVDQPRSVGGRPECNLPDKRLVINTRNLPNTGAVIKDNSKIVPATVFARMVYDNGAIGDTDLDQNKIAIGRHFRQSEGIWFQVDRVQTGSSGAAGGSDNTSYAYDFHIRACWETPGRSQPLKLGTIIRLHDPFIEGVR